MKPIVRDFKDNDYLQIIDLWAQTDLGRPERGDNLDTIKKTLSIEGAFFVIEIDKKIIGSSWITNDGRRLYLHHFGILPEYQAKGYSKLLVERSIDFAKKMKMQIKLEVHENNIKAINLYKKYNFVYLGDYDVYIIRKYD